MDEQESAGVSEAAELSSMDGQVTAEQAIEMRIEAARQARTQLKNQQEDFYNGDLVANGSHPRERVPIKLSYTSARGESPQHSDPLGTPPAPTPPLDIEGLRQLNMKFEAENEALKKKQEEATTVVMAVQHRHEANLVRLREKQAKQAAAISDRDKKIAEMQQTIDRLTSSTKSAEGAEEAYRGALEKLKKKDKMIAEMRLTIEKQTAAKRKLEDEQAGKAKQYKQVLTRVGNNRNSQDQELEAILSTVDLDNQKDDGRQCIEKLIAVVTQSKGEIQRLRLHAARTSSPGAITRTARTASPATTTNRTNSPSTIRRKESKDPDAWKTWMLKKKGQAAAAAAATPSPVTQSDGQKGAWRPGGVSKIPSQKSVVHQQEKMVPSPQTVPDVTPPTVTPPTVKQPDPVRVDRPDAHQPAEGSKEARQPPPGLLALVGGSRSQPKPSPSDAAVLTYGNTPFVTDSNAPVS
eukprot:TRINITY_DN3450_c0_g2_i2.p1 TRINITY_DN3450_c0_g2~~TRINITY_DN3450_c0_g2_i2.p1  ORF type:complete len:480 (+),score=127.72 TRINITY_DN3450_c0_g2_i2:48-1442(+)